MKRSDYYDFTEMSERFTWLSVLSLALYLQGKKFPFDVICSGGNYYCSKEQVNHYLNSEVCRKKIEQHRLNSSVTWEK